MTIVAPIFAKPIAVSLPIPELLPVMTHIFPFIALTVALPFELLLISVYNCALSFVFVSHFVSEQMSVLPVYWTT
jgi:hypothetical protein